MDTNNEEIKPTPLLEELDKIHKVFDHLSYTLELDNIPKYMLTFLSDYNYKDRIHELNVLKTILIRTAGAKHSETGVSEVRKQIYQRFLTLQNNMP